jgi:hypothetical protein
MHPSTGWITGFLLAIAAGVSATTWPGTAPCNGTLQACIDAAPAGDTIEIVTNGPIAESPAIGKSLTLRAAVGFSPLFTSTIIAGGGASDVTIVIEGFRIDGKILAVQTGTNAFNVSIRKNSITFGGSNFGIEVRSAYALKEYGPSTFEVSDNVITTTGFSVGSQLSGIFVGYFQGNASGVIQRNTIVEQGESTQNAAIDINNNLYTLSVDVIGNRISGSGFNDGIGIFQSGAGSTTARVIDNVVTGQKDVAGLPGAIALNFTAGSAAITVVNNTAVGNENGLQISGNPNEATVTGVVANNILANNVMDGVDIEIGFKPTVVNRYNLLFGNGSNEVTPGPGTVTSNPQFISATDYHLQPGSPAINAGSNADLPLDITTDADGAPRVAGGVVDIGAFEARPPARFFTVAPCRVVDTRAADGPYGGPVLVGGASRMFLVRGQCGIPTSARAISANLTAVLPAAEGFLTAYPGGPFPAVSTLNYRANIVRANNAILTLDGSGNLLVFTSVATNFLLDVNGYFE